MGVKTTTIVRNLLQKTGLLSDEQLDAVLKMAAEDGKNITEAVTALGVAPEDVFLQKVGELMRLSYTRLTALHIEPATLQKLPTKAVFQYNVIPTSTENGILQVATNDPFNAGLVDALRLASGMRVKIVLSPSEDIAKASKSFYGVGADTVDKMMQDDRFDLTTEDTSAKFNISELDQEASIVKFVNQIIWEACQQGATDIHLEPMETQLRIRYRVDGVLHQTPVPAALHRFQSAILSRIKVMANLDIAEKRLPMDGRIGLKVQGQDVDIRVSTMPTVYGESVSLRLLRRGTSFISIKDLGMSERDTKLIIKVINRPNGIVLVTGPTGSGKSTSLYAYLHEINTIDQRILTAEEPIEYEMPGVNQVLVRTDIGLTFARVLRSFLRQDPDIIMVGEVRDLETAEIAIQASLTGHLVFSTLHTNDAAGAFTRLLDMGVEPYLVASAVESVVAQRLVRRLCPSCKTKSIPEEALIAEVGFPRDRLPADGLYTHSTCEKCRMTGFSGRRGIFELLDVTDGVRSLVVQRKSMSVIKQQAISEGMSTLRDDGWAKVINGVTTIDEVIRATEEE